MSMRWESQMKIAVVGATGNVGTAVLRRLQADPEITEIVGISRKGPQREGEPYEGVQWHRVDVSEVGSKRQLIQAFQGVDAVIDLVWAIRPNRDRDFLRRTNIDGNRRVFEAVAAAGVPRLVYASSIGAYGPAPYQGRADESHPTTGTPSSHYAAHKAELEDILDEFEAEHPEVSVARMRPGLIFQAGAASEIKDYFLGKFVPEKLLSGLKLPVLPFPKGIRAQALHSDDVAEAYHLAAKSDATGAFNVAAEPVIGPEEAAQALGAKRVIQVPVPVIRALLQISYALRLQPTDPGWIDMAVNVPVMDTTRIREELGWNETTTSVEVIRELLDAFGGDEGLGNASHRSKSPFE